MAQLTIAKNSYAAIAYTPRIKASYPLYASRLADEFAGLIPNALLREMGLSELPLPVDTPGDILLKFVRDKETVLAMAAHRFILYARCAALRPLLEKDDVVVTVEGDVTRSAMLALVYYIYTGRSAALTESGGPCKALKCVRNFACMFLSTPIDRLPQEPRPTHRAEDARARPDGGARGLSCIVYVGLRF